MTLAETAEKPAHRRRKEARPAEIMDAALDEFWRSGLAATRLEDVAKRAGISKGTIYLYFESKQDLFRAVVRRAILPRLEEVESLDRDESGSAADMLRRQLEMHYAILLSPDVSRVFHLLGAEGKRFPELQDLMFTEVIQRADATIRKTIERGVKSGEFRETRLADFPQIIMGSIHAAEIWKTEFKDRDPLDLDAYMSTHVDLILNGLTSRDASRD